MNREVMDAEIFIDEVCNIITDQINKYDDMKVNKALSETLMLIIKLKTGKKKNLISAKSAKGRVWFPHSALTLATQMTLLPFSVGCLIKKTSSFLCLMKCMKRA